MLLRRDTEIEVYGFRTMDSLFPWDPLSRDLPERVAPLLDAGFLDEWADLLPEEWASVEPKEQPADGEKPKAPPPDLEEAEKEARTAELKLAAAEREVRSANENLQALEDWAGTVEVQAHAARREFTAAQGEAAAAQRLLGEAVNEAQEARRWLEAEMEGAGRGIGAIGGRVRVAMQRRRLGEAEQRVEADEALCWRTRQEEQQAGERLKAKESALGQARAKVEQARRIEAQAREALTLARQSAGHAAGVLTRLSASGPGPSGAATPYTYILLTRGRQVLGSLALAEWSRRVSGHGAAPKFILELLGEAIWLYKGEWYTADSELKVDDIMVLMDGVTRSRKKGKRSDASQPGLQSDVVTFVWERDGGRCVRCGSMANLEIDHIIPVFMGGSGTASNLQLLCRNCARDKSHQI